MACRTWSISKNSNQNDCAPARRGRPVLGISMYPPYTPVPPRRPHQVTIEIGCTVVPPDRPTLTESCFCSIHLTARCLRCIASRVRSAALTARRASIKACTSASRASAGRSGLVARHKRPQTTRYRPSGVRRGPSAACLGVALRMCGRNVERRGSEPCLPRMRCREAGGEPSELTIRGLAAVEVERTRRLAERVTAEPT